MIVRASLAVTRDLDPDGLANGLTGSFDVVGKGVVEVAQFVATMAAGWFDTEVAVVRCGAGPTKLVTHQPASVAERIVAFAAEPWEPGTGRVDADGTLTGVPLGDGTFALVALSGHVAGLVDRHRAELREAGLALLAADALDNSRQLRREVDALGSVTSKILSLRDLDQALLSTANVILDLLDADMAGVLLLDGDFLAMRCCVGNRSIEASRLRMARGCGVAGRVLATGQPCNVDRYLSNEHITHEFDSLARIEGARSAMAAPLRIHGEIIGVLEVWRRRRSPFSDADVAQLVALTNLAAIAIDNAGLFDQAQSSLAQLAATEQTLSEKVAALEHAAHIHRTLSDLLLEEEDLCALARTVATAVDGEVAILSGALVALAVSPRQFDVDCVASELGRVLGRHPQGVSGVELTSRPGWLTALPVRPGHQLSGWVCVVTSEPPTAMTDIVTASASTHTALWQVQTEAAERALSHAKERMLWDFVEGTAEQRRAAASRATRMRIELQGPMRVVVGSLHGVDEHAADQVWDSTRVDEFRRSLRARFVRIVSQAGAELSDLQGERFVAILPDLGDLERLVNDLNSQLAGAEALVIHWGISAAHRGPDELGVALDEADASIRVAARLGSRRWAVFDRLGLLQYLVGPVESTGLDRFASDVLGPLIEADAARPGGGELVATLQAYLEANCSQQEAAKRLFIHHKTMRYRIERIEKLSSLDMRSHSDRMRADVALKINAMVTEL